MPSGMGEIGEFRYANELANRSMGEAASISTTGPLRQNCARSSIVPGPLLRTRQVQRPSGVLHEPSNGPPLLRMKTPALASLWSIWAPSGEEVVFTRVTTRGDQPRRDSGRETYRARRPPPPDRDGATASNLVPWRLCLPSRGQPAISKSPARRGVLDLFESWPRSCPGR